jgi:CheY-like chemotaxis protein
MKKITSKFPGKRVLVVDDYFVNQEVVQDFLELMECTVEVAENGKEAFQKHSINQYDIIFMDIQMPVMDGFKATIAIRKSEGNNKHTPIIALTANALAGMREECLKAGMDDYLTKPIEGEKLEQLLQKHLDPNNFKNPILDLQS